MQRIPFALLTLLILMAGMNTAFANQAGWPDAVLLDAMSPCEDLIESVLSGQKSALPKYRAALDQQNSTVQTALPAPAAQQYAILMDAMHKAGHDALLQAMCAANLFRLLAENLRTDGELPKEVSLLDYAGFKLRILAASKDQNWQVIVVGIQEANSWWENIKPQVTSTQLRNTFELLLHGLEKAAQDRNLELLAFAAHMELELVDLLETDMQQR